MEDSSSRDPQSRRGASSPDTGPSDREGANLRVGARAFGALAVITYVLLVFGATVRVHGAGLSCPDWPLCFGEVIPQLNFLVFLEWGHRVLAGSISVGFLALGGWIFAHPVRRSLAGARWCFALCVLITQIVLGGLTVLKSLAFWSVTLHLLTGNLFLLALLAVRATLAPSPLPASPASRGLAWAVVGMWFVQMALGGLVSSNYAGLACTEWPTCNGGVWFPVLDGIIGLQLAHRAGAYVLFTLAAVFYVKSFGQPMAGPAKRVFGTVLVQVGIGILNVLWAMPVEIAVLHSAIADLIGVFAVLAVLRLPMGEGMQPAPVADNGSSV